MEKRIGQQKGQIHQTVNTVMVYHVPYVLYSMLYAYTVC